MSENRALSYLAALDTAAREASAAEDDFRNNIALKIREYEQARAFAFRRYNLMKDVTSAVAPAEDEEAAKSLGVGAFYREVGWTGATEFQRESAERFAPVALAIWAASKPEADETSAETIARELAAFEAWFAQSREQPFLTLMEQEVPELPLVEVF